MAEGGDSDQAIWRALLGSQYFTVPGHGCTTCASARDCNNFFCLKCKVGGLCPAKFHTRGDHCHHPWIQVRKVTYGFAVLEDELIRFIGSGSLEHIQKYSQNGKKHCKLLKSARGSTGESSRRKLCQGCEKAISHSDIPNSSDTPVCSLECLLDYAERNPRKGLVRLVTGAEDGAMDPPKRNNVGKCKAPVDEQSAEATRDQDVPGASCSSRPDDNEVQRPVGEPAALTHIIRRQIRGLGLIIKAVDVIGGQWELLEQRQAEERM